MHKSIKHGLDSWYGHVIELFDDGNGKYSFKDEYGKLHSNLSLKQANEMYDEAYHLKPYNSTRADTDDVIASNDGVISLEELLRKNGISQSEFKKMRDEMQRKGASAVHFIRGKDGRLVYKADGMTVENSCASTNSVVRNAMEWKARNATDTELNEGDIVTYDRFPGKKFKVRKCGSGWCRINEIGKDGKYIKGKYGLDYGAFEPSVAQVHKVS